MEDAKLIAALTIAMAVLIAAHLSSGAGELIVATSTTSVALWFSASQPLYLSQKFAVERQASVVLFLGLTAVLYLSGVPYTAPFYHAGVSILCALIAGVVMAFVLESRVVRKRRR
jgi:hypothetical protein